MDWWSALIIGSTLFVAYANGANDNFKGVATLFGSGTTDYRKALWWGTLTTLAGSIATLFLPTELISTFQGKGLVPADLAQSQPFIAAVVLGAAMTVFFATKAGLPVSTTHSLTGALLGSGFVALGLQLGFSTLLSSFFLPLLVSPLLSVVLAAMGYPILGRVIKFPALSKKNCVCVGSEVIPAAVTPEGCALSSTVALRVLVDTQGACDQIATQMRFGVSGQRLLDGGHFLSAGAVSFARGLNDTPKIVALGLMGSALELSWSIALIALVIAVGGLMNGRKVADMISNRITGMDPDHGLMANLVTSFLVIFASKWGVPVSTTHVSCGALFGIGMANGQARWPVIRTILFAWIVTLPFAGISAGLIYWILARLAQS
jgi:inorganic phosphate transporter, PiT family